VVCIKQIAGWKTQCQRLDIFGASGVHQAHSPAKKGTASEAPAWWQKTGSHSLYRRAHCPASQAQLAQLISMLTRSAQSRHNHAAHDTAGWNAARKHHLLSFVTIR
jgi:UDP-N-acetyl-D-mannosaminuronic acid transferase (WecB/TagA/CpsF family)